MDNTMSTMDNSMRSFGLTPSMKAFFACLVSAIAGFVVAWLFFALPAGHQNEDASVGMCESDLITLELARKGEIGELVSRKEKRLVTWARMLGTDLRRHPGAEFFLWRIRDYYRVSSNSIPDDIREILNAVPEQKPTPDRLYHFGS